MGEKLIEILAATAGNAAVAAIVEKNPEMADYAPAMEEAVTEASKELLTEASKSLPLLARIFRFLPQGDAGASLFTGLFSKLFGR